MKKNQIGAFEIVNINGFYSLFVFVCYCFPLPLAFENIFIFFSFFVQRLRTLMKCCLKLQTECYCKLQHLVYNNTYQVHG